MSFDRSIKFFNNKKSIRIWSLAGIRCCQRGKHRWISPFARWSPCMLCVLPLRLVSWKWSKHFKLDSVREIKYYIYLLWIGQERSNLLILTLTFGIPTRILKMRILNTFFFKICISSFYPIVCFLCGMATIGCKPSCLTLNMCIMKILNGTT